MSRILLTLRGPFEDLDLITARTADATQRARALSRSEAKARIAAATFFSPASCDTFSPNARSKAEVAHLFEEVERGMVIVLVRPRRRVVRAVDGPEVIGPALPASDETTTWFEIKLVDEVGEPLSNVPLTFSFDGKKVKRPTDGSGQARIDGRGGFATVTVDDENALRTLLRERWSKPRGKEWLAPSPETEARHAIVEVRRRAKISPVAAPCESLHTIVLQPRVVQASLEGMWFASSKSFLLPTARYSLQLVKGLYDENHESDMLIVGHTDTAGSAQYNDPLSLERAESIAAYLKDDVDAWCAWYSPSKPAEKRWGPVEDSAMIRALAEEGGEVVAPGQSELRWYQASRGLPVSGNADEATRRALVREYMGLDGTTLPDDIHPIVHGCGENFPAKKTGDETSAQENRRVEVFFFDNPIAPPDRPDAVLPPPPGKNSKPGSKEYPEWLLS